MRLTLTKPIVGIRDRGKPTESKHVYALPGEIVKVLFNDTEETMFGYKGHCTCVKDDQDFIVFTSQFNEFIKEKEREDDIFHSEFTEDIED